MKNLIMRGLLLYFLLFTVTPEAKATIPLVSGEAVFTHGIGSGRPRGLKLSFLNDLSGSEVLNHFNPGFDFHLFVKDNSFVSSGVFIKSHLATTGTTAFLIGDADFNSICQDGTLTKMIRCFYVPVIGHHPNNNPCYLETGLQAGQWTKAVGIFAPTNLESDYIYIKAVKDQFVSLDSVLLIGAGYKFKEELKCREVGIA